MMKSKQFSKAENAKAFTIEHEKKSVADLKEERSELQERGKTILKQARNGEGKYDWSQVEEFKGKETKAECLEAYQQLEDQANLITSVIETKHAESALGGGDEEKDEGVASKSKTPNLIASMEELRKAAGQPKGFSTEIAEGARKIFAAVFKTTDGYDPKEQDLDYVRPNDRHPRTLLDVLRSSTTTTDTINYKVANVVANSPAAATAEEGAYTEVDYSYSDESTRVRKVTVIIPITDEEFQDAPESIPLIEARLVRDLRDRLENQVAVGNGSAPNLRGLFNTSNIQTKAYSSGETATFIDSFLDNAGLLEDKGYGRADFIAVNPADLRKLAQIKDSDGRYLYGDPATSSVSGIWGIPLVKNPAIAVNSALLGDSMYHYVAYRTQAALERGYDDGDFSNGRVSIRGSVRAANVVLKPNAFVKITGLNHTA